MDENFTQPPAPQKNNSFPQSEGNTNGKVGQEQIHSLLFGEKLSWQQIIYDLINTEQLDPWDIDLVLLTNKYLEKIREMEEANLFVSSKVLFAAALLLRIKSEILLNHYLQNLDDILFGRDEKRVYAQERIELEEDVPELIPRTPLPRFRKVTLEELMMALGKAVKTENRRIQKVAVEKQREIEAAILLPRRTINIRDRIKEVYSRVKEFFVGREEKISFSEFVGGGNKLEHFVPLLHLDSQHKVLLEQEKHLDEIYIWLKKLHSEKYKEELEMLKRDVEEDAYSTRSGVGREEERVDEEEGKLRA